MYKSASAVTVFDPKEWKSRYDGVKRDRENVENIKIHRIFFFFILYSFLFPLSTKTQNKHLKNHTIDGKRLGIAAFNFYIFRYLHFIFTPEIVFTVIALAVIGVISKATSYSNSKIRESGFIKNKCQTNLKERVKILEKWKYAGTFSYWPTETKYYRHRSVNENLKSQ